MSLPADSVEGLGSLYEFRDLSHFIEVWELTTCALRAAQDFRQVVVDYAAEAPSHGPVYLEGIFTPAEPVRQGARSGTSHFLLGGITAAATRLGSYPPRTDDCRWLSARFRSGKPFTSQVTVCPSVVTTLIRAETGEMPGVTSIRLTCCQVSVVSLGWPLSRVARKLTPAGSIVMRPEGRRRRERAVSRQLAQAMRARSQVPQTCIVPDSGHAG